MIRTTITVVGVLLILLLSITRLSKENTSSYYDRLSRDQNITQEVKLKHILKWFSTQVDDIEFDSVKKGRNVICTYTLIDKDKFFGTLTVLYIKDNPIYKDIILSMRINGRIKTLYDTDAIRHMVMFLNNNNEFDYKFMD